MLPKEETMTKRSFAADIRGLFRDSDIEAMKPAGIDLASYETVKRRAADIHRKLAAGEMPCDKPWSAADLAKLKEWMDGGFQP
jgi:hypothetical protein